MSDQTPQSDGDENTDVEHALLLSKISELRSEYKAQLVQRAQLDEHLRDTGIELCLPCAPAGAEAEDAAPAEAEDAALVPTTEPEAEMIRRFAERPRENFFEVKCMVSRIGEMVRASAPGFGVKAFIDPLPGYHWSVCIRRNYQSAKEHKDRCIPYFGDDQEGVGLDHLEDDSDSEDDYDSDLESDKRCGPERAFVLSRLQIPAYELTEKVVSWLADEMEMSHKFVRKAIGATRGIKSPEKEVDAEKKYEDLDSYRILFCRRCYKYDCHIHGTEQPLPTYRLIDSPSAEDPGPCGPECWKHEEGKQESLKQSAKRKEAPWSDDERAIFRRAREAFQSNWCRVEKLLANRSCSECFRRSKIEGERAVTKNVSVDKAINASKLFRDTVRERERRSSSLSYRPCNHEGPCDSENCSCYVSGHFCEKFCGCAPSCKKRFPGCHCKLSQCRTKACPCFAANRECDPDLCMDCGAAQEMGRRCKNVSIQRGEHKHLVLGRSKIAGWGTFLREAAKKHDYIHEYVGECISQKEAERRGLVYDRKNQSFLFNLNEEMAIDATRKGNKTKYANHSSTPNCCAKILMVNGDHRIGIFAKEDIAAGTEILYDYMYRGSAQPQWWDDS